MFDSLNCELSSDPKEKLRGLLLASLILNHCASIFSDTKAELLEGPDASYLENDLRDVCQLRLIRSAWSELRCFQPPEFSVAIERLMSKSGQD